MRSPALHRCALACATVLWLSSACAATVHTWVDADGVRHYSDAPPADGKEARQIEIEDAPPRPAGDDYYSIVNQWNRTRAEREAGTAQQIERERVEATAPQPPPPPPDATQSEPSRGVIYPGFVPYGYGAGAPPYGGRPVQGRHHHHPDYDDEPPPVSAPPPPPGRTSAGNPHSVNSPAPVLPSQR